MKYSMKVSVRDLLDGCLFAILAVFLFYTLWYQYAIGEIRNLLSICGVLMVVLLLCRLCVHGRLNEYATLSLIYFFVIYAALTGLVFAISSSIE